MDAGDGPRNMAVDSALHDSVRTGGRAVLRLYRWTPACLSFGRNQHARDSYDAGAIAAAGLDVVRRPTGGLAVLHDRELTYCVAAPLADLGGPRAAYHAINRALVEGVHSLGIDARLAASGVPREPRKGAAEPCFRAPAAGEVMVAGRKLIGSAQRCEGGALLQHGSILLSDSQTRVAGFTTHAPAPARRGSQDPTAVAVLPQPHPAHAAGAVALDEVLGAEPDVDVLAAAISRGFERTFGIRLAPACLTRDEAGNAERLVARYADPDWTWRL
jgi:lipoyl(octanoyl) transferase